MAKIGSVEVTEKMVQDALLARAEGNGYTGAGDNLIDFGSASSFVDEDSSAKRFSLKISNKSDADELVQLNDIIATIDEASLIKEGEIKSNLIALENEKLYQEMKSKYFGICLRNKKFIITALKSVDEFIQEGNAMHHCVFTNKYFPNDKKFQLLDNPIDYNTFASLPPMPIECIYLNLNAKDIFCKSLKKEIKSFPLFYSIEKEQAL